MSKTPIQLDRDIAEALAEARTRQPRDTDKTDLLHVKFSQGLGSILARSQYTLFKAMRRTKIGYAFESADSVAIRALWQELSHLYFHPSISTPTALWRAAGRKLVELQPILAASWPSALVVS